MIVYVDGKPVLVQNPKSENQKLNTDIGNSSNRTKKSNKELTKNTKNSNKSNLTNRPVAKIPYLLAAAAAASTHRQKHEIQNYQQQNSRLISNSSLFGTPEYHTISSSTIESVKDLKHD